MEPLSILLKMAGMKLEVPDDHMAMHVCMLQLFEGGGRVVKKRAKF